MAPRGCRSVSRAHANRWMNDRDFAARMGVRSLAAAVTRLRSTDAAAIRQLSLSGELPLDGFKGPQAELSRLGRPAAPADPAGAPTRTGFQLAAGRLSASHQRAGHPGLDAPESRCRLDQQEP